MCVGVVFGQILVLIVLKCVCMVCGLILWFLCLYVCGMGFCIGFASYICGVESR